ncbi:MAG: FecR family protein [Burkholderiales bacterium]|nr:FecR family protein [Burkholderiales bacterium]
MKFHVRNGLPIALVLLLAPAPVHAAAGRVLMAAGDAVAVRDGKEVKLAAGTEINDRDVLRTGTASNLQVRMTDESVVALKERTTLSIDQYRFSGRQDGSERAFYRLLKGGFRTISGLIGKTNRANYEVRTSVATIGIRGTAYSLALCASGSCTNANGTAAKDGLYGAVTEGKVAASNGKGAFEFVAGEAFYAPRPDVGVEKLLVPPAFLADRLEGQKRGSNQPQTAKTEAGATAATTGTASKSEAAGSITTGSTIATPLVTVPNPTPGSAVQTAATENKNTVGAPEVLPPRDGFVAAFPIPTGGTDFYFGGKVEGTYDAAGNLVAFTTPDGVVSGSLAGGTIQSPGSFTDGGTVVTWGRWSGGTITGSDGRTLTNFPLVFATTNHSAAGVQQVLPSAGVVSYTPVGGPGAVASDGSLGTLAGSRLTIDFTAQQASFGTTVNFATLNKSFAVSGIAGPNQGGGLGDYFGHTSVTCTGCSGGSYSGSVSVGLTGTNGYGTAVTAGCLGDIANGFNATFVEVFRKQ